MLEAQKRLGGAAWKFERATWSHFQPIDFLMATLAHLVCIKISNP
jgi:hypothetical protein